MDDGVLIMNDQRNGKVKQKHLNDKPGDLPFAVQE